MLSRLLFYCFIGIFFFASLTETVFSKGRLTTGDPGANPDNLIIQNKPSKAGPGNMSTKTDNSRQKSFDKPPGTLKPITLFMCGDVMLGRGIDQVLAHPCDPVLYEPYMEDAGGYVELAEKKKEPDYKKIIKEANLIEEQI